VKRVCVVLGVAAAILAAAATAGYVWAFPSEGFYTRGGDTFDDWQICRTTAFGEDGFYQAGETGFRPAIAFESLGQQANIAYSLGERIADEYPNPLQRAEAIFSFVRDRVRYTSDVDWSGNEEFARNADELAASILEDGFGNGDCEDMTVLLAVMYKAAGFRSAVVLLSGHTSIMVYLPDYSEATAFFELEGETGWIWAEATGRNNPLGWAPKEYLDMEIPAYEILAEVPAYEIPAGAAAPLTPPPDAAIAFAGTGEGAAYPPYLFLIVIGLLSFLSLLRRSRRR
jgi:Transglutaminase-like superfamily